MTIDIGAFSDTGATEVFPEMPLAKQSPPVNDAALNDQIRNEHYHSGHTGSVKIYAFPDHQVAGNGWIRSVESGEFVIRPDVVPRYFHKHLTTPEPTLPSYWSGPLVTDSVGINLIEINTPIGVCLNPNMIYGHFLLEMLPKLYLLRSAIDMGIDASLLL